MHSHINLLTHCARIFVLIQSVILSLKNITILPMLFCRHITDMNFASILVEVTQIVIGEKNLPLTYFKNLFALCWTF